MPKFSYYARDQKGRALNGQEEAGSQEEMIQRLQARDLLVIEVLQEDESGVAGKALIAQAAASSKLKRKHSGCNSEDLTLFCRQLATLLGAGVTIFKSLDVISQQVGSQKLFAVIRGMQKSMEAGLSLHEAMAKYPRLFSNIWVNLVESGEASGNLALVLNRLAGYLERNASFKRKIISALAYPSILLCAGTGALLFLTLKIIPTFVDLFKGFNLDLPALTKMLVAVSSFTQRYFLIIIAGIIGGVILLRKYISTRDGKRNWDKFLLSLPVFGEFFRVYAIEHFTSEMATLVESGVPILYSLEIAGKSVNNYVLGDIIKNIQDEVRNGKTLSQPMDKSGFFDPMAVQMVAIGEEIGELSNMFKRLNAFYEEYIDTFLTRFTAMFEPIMLLFMGGVIGIMVVGMFLPIFQITKLH